MNVIEVFVQTAGDSRIEIISVAETALLRDLVRAAAEKGLQVPADGGLIFVDEVEIPFPMSASLKDALVKRHSRVHVHRCKEIEVTVHFTDKTHKHVFRPSVTVKHVLHWALRQFDVHGPDKADHALQICNTTERPAPDLQIGALTELGHCDICFDLVPIQRVEG